MKKRIVSFLMCLVMAFSIVPAAAWAEMLPAAQSTADSGGNAADVYANGEDTAARRRAAARNSGPVAEVDGTRYATLQEILDEISEVEITLLSDVAEDLTVYAATTIDMAGFCITGDIDADDSLTLTNGTVVGQVTVDAADGTFTMTAPAGADAAIDGGLTVNNGSASISGAKVGVKSTLYFDGTDLTITGTDKAVELTAAAGPAGKKFYGAADADGDTAAEAVFAGDTYTVNGAAAKKLSSRQVGGEPAPEPPTLTLDRETANGTAGGAPVTFTVTYTGTDDLKAYVQNNSDDKFTVTQTDNGGGTYTISVKISAETPAGEYTFYVHEVNNAFVQAKAVITVAAHRHSFQPVSGQSEWACSCGLTCDHGGTSGFAYDAGSCPDCGAPAVAQTALQSVEGNPWRQFADLQDALNADRDGSYTLRLLAEVSGDYTVDGTRYTGIDLNGHSIRGTVTVTGGDYEVSFSRTNDTDIVEKVIAHAGAKFATPAKPAVIGTLELAEGATWENIVSSPRNPGYKVYTDYPNDLTKYTWYAPADEQLANTTKLTNVTIERLPITSKNLHLKVNGKNVSSVDRGTTVQLCAYCNTKNADVTFYIQKEGSETPITLTDPTYEKISSSWYYVSKHVFTETGRYTIWFTAVKDGYTVQSSSKTLKVNQPSIPTDQINAPAAVTGLTYTGAAQELVTAGSVDAKYGMMQYSLSRSSGYSTDIPTGTNAGTYRVYYKVIGINGYKDSTPKAVSVTIAPKELTVAGVTIAPKVYDGTTTATVTGVTFSGLQGSDTLYNGLNYTSTAAFDSADAGSGRTVTGTVTLDRSVKNYTLPDGSYTQPGCTIQQAAVTDPTPVELTIINGAAREYTITLPTLPALESPRTYGDTTCAQPSVSLNEGYTATAVLDSAANEVKLSVTATDNTEGAVGTIKVTVTTNNYTPITLTVNVTAAAKRPLTPIGLAAGDITYGQTLRDSVLGYNGEYGGMRYNGELVQGTLCWKDDTIKPDKAGMYTGDWVFTPTGDDAYLYEETTGTADVQVNKAQFTNVSVRQVGTLTYNGQPQTAVVKTAATSVDGISGTFGFSTKNGIGTAYHSAVPAFTDAGKHTVYYIVYDVVNWNYEYYRGEFTVTIEPKEVTATVTVPGAPFIYNNGTAIEPTVEVYDNGTLIPASEYTVSYKNNTEAGEATVTVTDNPGGNYIVSGSTTFTIDRAASSVTEAPAANALTYTGAQQALAAAGTAEGGTMQYSLDGVDYSDAVPTGTNAGTYTVWYKVQGDSNHNDTEPRSVTVTIEPKTVEAAVTVSDGSFIYNGGKWEPAVTVRDGETVIDPAEYTVSYDRNTNAGEAAVIVTDNPGGNYTVSGTASFTIDRADAQLTGHPTANALTYTGAQQALVTDGTAEGGAMQYSLNGVHYSADIPTGRLPGTYTVYYKVQGDQNHNSTDTWSLTAAIDKAELTNVSVSAPALAYNGKAQTPAVTVTADTADGSPVTVTYSEEENGTYTASVPSYGAVGSYTLYYRLTAANHEPVSGSLSVSVDKGTLTVPDITVDVTNGAAVDYTVDLQAALDAVLPAGCVFGRLRYGGLHVTDAQGYCDMLRTNVSRKGALTLAVNAVDSTAEGDAAVVTAFVESDNYQDITVTVRLRAVNKLIPTGTPSLSSRFLTGGQRLDTITLSGIMAAEGKVVRGTFTWAEPYLCPAVGRYTATWVFTPDDTDRYAVVTGTADITVTAPAEPVYTVSGEVKGIDLTDSTRPGAPVPDAVVTIRRGLEIIGGWKTTDTDGRFSLDDMPAGVYNVVVEYNDRIVTRMVTLVDHNVTGLLVEIPRQDVNSELTIRSASGLTDGAIVGELDDEAARRFSGVDSDSLSVSMELREVPANSGDPIQKALRDRADGMKLRFVDMAMTLTENGVSSGLTQTDTLLEIILSYDTSLSGVTVLRSGSGKFEPRGLTGSEAEGYYVDKANGRIHIFTRQMTTYAIGYAVSGTKPDSTPSIRDTTSPATGDAGLAVYAVMALSSCTGAALLLRRRREHA